jgi:hypothetical protein
VEREVVGKKREARYHGTRGARESFSHTIGFSFFYYIALSIFLEFPFLKITSKDRKGEPQEENRGTC